MRASKRGGRYPVNFRASKRSSPEVSVLEEIETVRTPARSPVSPYDEAQEPLTKNQWRLFASLALVIGATRVWALSRTYWDWDEALFASAVVDFDVSKHHPHPPGFPVFIALAKLFRLFIGTEFHALQAVNLIAALLLFPAAFFLARGLRLGFRVSILSATLLAFIPTVWVFGGTAFSDVPSLTLVVAACAFLLRGARDRTSYFVGTFVLALAIGVRSQNLLVGFVPGAIATWVRVRVRWTDVVLAALLGAVVAGAAYGGAVYATGSWADYRETVEIHRAYIMKMDSYASEIRPPMHDVFKEFFVRQYGGGAWNYVLSILVIAALLVAAVDRSRPVLVLLLTFGPFCLFAWLFLDHLSANRFSIGYIPLFAILAAYALSRLGDALGRLPHVRADVATLVLAMVLIGGLIGWTVPAIRTVRSTPSPTAETMAWIRANIDPRASHLYVAKGMMPFAGYALRDYAVTQILDDRDIPVSDRTSSSHSWVVIEGISGGDGHDFVRPRNRLWHIVRHRYFETTVFPLRNTAWFTEGWYEAENEGTELWRWMSGRSVTELAPMKGNARLELHLQVPLDSLKSIPTITVSVNGRVVDRFRGETEYIDRAWTVPARSDGPNILVIETDKTVNPKKAGLAEDTRDLGILLHSIKWSS